MNPITTLLISPFILLRYTHLLKSLSTQIRKRFGPKWIKLRLTEPTWSILIRNVYNTNHFFNRKESAYWIGWLSAKQHFQRFHSSCVNFMYNTSDLPILCQSIRTLCRRAYNATSIPNELDCPITRYTFSINCQICLSIFLRFHVQLAAILREKILHNIENANL